MARGYVMATVPTPGQVISVVLEMSTFGVLCMCFMRRSTWFKNFRTLPLAIWLILIIYIDSTIFILASSILTHGFGINSSRAVCEGGILLCLICYMTTKILIYYFLVERAYIVRGSRKPRLQTKLWLFNCLFMILPYTILVALNFVWRIAYIDDKGVCIIGMEMRAMLPLIIFEVVVNVYLTLLFVLPLRKLYSYRHSKNPKLNRMAFRSLVGSLSTLFTSVANLTVLMVLRGEPGWICLLCCNADLLFCVLVLHWVTSKDKPTNSVTPPLSHGLTPNSKQGARSTPQPQNIQKGIMPEGLSARDAKHDIIEHTHELQLPGHRTWAHTPAFTKPAGTVTTDIRSSCSNINNVQGMFPKSSRNSTSESGDEVELHNIHVQQSVYIEHGSRGESPGPESHSGYGREVRSVSVEDAWGMGRSISAMKMV